MIVNVHAIALQLIVFVLVLNDYDFSSHSHSVPYQHVRHPKKQINPLAKIKMHFLRTTSTSECGMKGEGKGMTTQRCCSVTRQGTSMRAFGRAPLRRVRVHNSGGYRYQRNRDEPNMGRNWRDDILTEETKVGSEPEDEGGESYRSRQWQNSDWAQESTSQSDSFAGWSTGGTESSTGGWGDATGMGRSNSRRSNNAAGSEAKGGTSSVHMMDIFPLKGEDLQLLFPLSGTPSQYSYYFGSWDQAVQRFAISLLTTLVATNSSPVLAAGAFSYCLWGPVAQAIFRNISVKKYNYGGFWTASVLDLSFSEPFQPDDRNSGRNNRFSTPSRTVIHVGAEKVADVIIEVPYDNSHEFIRVGDPAYVVVVSNSPSLNSFKAVRDIFLPATRSWLYEYPFISRQGFKNVAQKALYFMNKSN